MVYLIRLLAPLLLIAPPALAADDASYAALLARYTGPDGFDYQAWHAAPADHAALTEVVAAYGRIDSKALAPNDRKAFLINLYNAAMLQAALDNYPLKSVTDIGLVPFSIFKRQWIALDGDRVSLDDIEKGILLREYPDARVHFAVNCASASCPPLRSEPYIGARLETQLEEQTRLFAASDHAATVDSGKKRIEFSKLFKWYREDFDVSNPAIYLNGYRDEPLPTSYKVAWQPYDWSLNQSR